VLLAIDAGNTFVKIGYHDGQMWQSKQRIALADFCVEPLRYLQQPAQQAVIANVAGPAFQAAFEATLPLQPKLWLQASAQACGVTNQYQTQKQLGADRWAMLIAARAMASQPCVVASLGTTLTVDVLTADGAFVGGCIAPGLNLMRSALAQGTYALQTPSGHVTAYPTNTADAVETGIIFALAGTIEKVMANVAQQTPASLQLILTGGDAHLLTPHLNRAVQVVDNLVLEGLLVLARKENLL